MTAKIPFHVATPDAEAARQILLAWLRANAHRPVTVPRGAEAFLPFAELDGDIEVLSSFLWEAFWRLVAEGILVPGQGLRSPDPRYCCLTSYGKKVVHAAPPNPYDPTGFLEHLQASVAAPDATVMAYLKASLDSHGHGDHVASVILLGVAAERVYLLVADSLGRALADATEQRKFEQVMGQFPMNPKLNFIHSKVQQLQARRPRPHALPENVTIALDGIFDLLRQQRNDLGHPQDLPPEVKPYDAFTNLSIFPRFYKVAEEMREFLAANKI